jgi:hypothetical protein
MLLAGMSARCARVVATARDSASTTKHALWGNLADNVASLVRTLATRASIAVVRAIRRTENTGSVGCGPVFG